MKKKLDLTEEFYRNVCLPEIEKKLPDAAACMAAGLVGEGSECFGFDDEVSVDHDSEIRVFFWFDGDDFAKYAKPLSEILAEMPESYEGVPVKLYNSYRSGIFEIGSFYTMLCGFPRGPQTSSEWLDVPDPMLAAATNGRVFTDNKGAFTEIRKYLLEGRPEDVRIRAIAQCMAIAAQTGQYNYFRSLKRNDVVLQGVVKGRFVENIASIIFLLNGHYKPFYKWSYRALKELPILGAESYELMDRILCEDREAAIDPIEELSRLVIAELKNQGLANEENKDDFLMNHVGDVLGKIKDEKLRTRNISMVF